MQAEFKGKNLNIFGNVLQIKLSLSELSSLTSINEDRNAEKFYTIEIKGKKKNRSLTANAYMWVLCQEIAIELSKDKTMVTKEDVYKQAVKSCGHFTPIPIKDEAIDRFKGIWSAHGIGWLSENIGKAKTPGYSIIAAYHGSSTYDSHEMARLIDYLIDECEQLGLHTRPQYEIDELVKEWGMNE